ncbi:hypothetical protein Vi05172_g7523 [Venturia inaequalis]|nr:hypothetical protein Vi05172_g7523 [Venturia inaequalis]
MVVGEPLRALFRKALCLGITVPTEFTSFLEQWRPRAIAIFAHYCAVAYCINDHWIFHGLAEQKVEDLGALLPEEWHWAMGWPNTLIASMKAVNPPS